MSPSRSLLPTTASPTRDSVAGLARGQAPGSPPRALRRPPSLPPRGASRRLLTGDSWGGREPDRGGRRRPGRVPRAGRARRGTGGRAGGGRGVPGPGPSVPVALGRMTQQPKQRQRQEEAAGRRRGGTDRRGGGGGEDGGKEEPEGGAGTTSPHLPRLRWAWRAPGEWLRPFRRRGRSEPGGRGNPRSPLLQREPRPRAAGNPRGRLPPGPRPMPHPLAAPPPGSLQAPPSRGPAPIHPSVSPSPRFCAGAAPPTPGRLSPSYARRRHGSWRWASAAPAPAPASRAAQGRGGLVPRAVTPLCASQWAAHEQGPAVRMSRHGKGGKSPPHASPERGCSSGTLTREEGV